MNTLENDPIRSKKISYGTVYTVIKREKNQPYHYAEVKTLFPEDFQRRTDFCNWLLEKVTENNIFVLLSKVL